MVAEESAIKSKLILVNPLSRALFDENIESGQTALHQFC